MLNELNIKRFDDGYGLTDGCLAYDLMQNTFDIGEWVENTAREIKSAQNHPVRLPKGRAAGYVVNSKVLARAILGLG
jgi:hypothetical protein